MHVQILEQKRVLSDPHTIPCGIWKKYTRLLFLSNNILYLNWYQDLSDQYFHDMITKPLFWTLMGLGGDRNHVSHNIMLIPGMADVKWKC